MALLAFGAFAFVEVDRGTMSYARLLAKVDRYAAYRTAPPPGRGNAARAARNHWQEHYAGHALEQAFPPLLVVFAPAARLRAPPRVGRVPGAVGDKRCDGPSADGRRDPSLARCMTGGEVTLGAVRVRLEEREREIAAQAEQTREQIVQLTAMLEELDRAVEEVRMTRKTLLELPESGPPTPPTGSERSNKAAYQEILAVFAEARGPLRARGVCEAMDLAPNSINNVRIKLKRLAGRGILTEPEPGLFTLPRP
ncbi:hypothetical protein SAMN05216223_11680 [Actinacidiphila yanglinensis]|uniref:Uncharacterized protein n=1 Tax=Actinacidiphila yanglinensis TaxID=310779 RepID=A0A1H6DLB5_9ACTN|nr:replication-relaxation family protein [Actinacidiphila yanglinensis]SEG85506.1 hypothetical protein SAMN05216223_11680 [Actinacidiphila yanglinensis]